MAATSNRSISYIALHFLVIVTGFATLSWEVIWQIKLSLALGVSAWGTALTLAVTMGGMSLGSIFAGRALRERTLLHPARLYGAFEIIIGVAGLCLGGAFHALENFDTIVYRAASGSAWLVYLSGIIAVLCVPALCMGATLPVFGMIARQYRTSIALLYGLNTIGAAAGVLAAAFLLIPLFGITNTTWIIAAFNIAVGIATWLLVPGPGEIIERRKAKTLLTLSPSAEQLIVFVTGFATFSLEIAWFRALTAAFHSTTDAFALMLAAMLLALGASALLVPRLHMKVQLGSLISGAGISILLVTPIIERFSIFLPLFDNDPVLLVTTWFAVTLLVIAVPVFLLGLPFPWIINEQTSVRRWGILYGINTFAAIAGALGAAWILLPAMGFTRTAWLIGTLVTGAGILISPGKRRLVWSVLCIAGLLVAVNLESGIGRTQVSGHFPAKIIEFYEGPDVSVAAVDYDCCGRALMIDGFTAAGQFGVGDTATAIRYMAWMGHLPMLLNPHPEDALVICFGTGQTANAVRRENPKSLDIVDINPRVIKLSHNFSANQNVLGDPEVKLTIMDGRAYMRRTDKKYDVITMEPMPPSFAGVNALYSREFYELARQRLKPHGMIAQWVPFSQVAPYYAASIVRTFRDAFPNAILWNDLSPKQASMGYQKSGILIGTVDDDPALGTIWPGFARTKISREFSEAEVRNQIVLNRQQLEHYSMYGEIITDDNQLLAYGKAVNLSHVYPARLQHENVDLLNQVSSSTDNSSP